MPFMKSVDWLGCDSRACITENKAASLKTKRHGLRILSWFGIISIKYLALFFFLVAYGLILVFSFGQNHLFIAWRNYSILIGSCKCGLVTGIGIQSSLIISEWR